MKKDSYEPKNDKSSDLSRGLEANGVSDLREKSETRRFFDSSAESEMRQFSNSSVESETRQFSDSSKRLEFKQISNLSVESETDNSPVSSQHLRLHKTSRSLEELTMLDAFLFMASTEKIQNAEFIAKIIIERATGRKVDKIVVESEKQLSGIDIDSRGVRLDLCISEIENEKLARVYDIEPNNYDIDILPKRDRFYQSVLDVKLLESGQRFYELPEMVSIWILPKDPFGDNRMIYTVKNVVEENNELLYNDGVKKLFLYINGEYGGSKELKALLKYMSSTNATDAVDAELEKLHKVVDAVKHSREVGERYMTLQDLIDVEKDRSYQEGVEAMREDMQNVIDKEKEAGIKVLIRTCKSFGQDDLVIKGILMKEYSLSEEAAEKYLN